MVAQLAEDFCFHIEEASCRLQSFSIISLGLELLDHASGMIRQVQVLCQKGLTKPAYR
jgi:hypothetical protein